MPRAFDELLLTNQYCIETYNKIGIYSGITYARNDQSTVNYGGDVWANRFLGTTKRLGVSYKPQECIMANARILLVPVSVVDRIGIFYEGYKHGRVDNDYSMLARLKGIPVLITADVCGVCENDHGDSAEVYKHIINMSQKERTAYFNHPLHCNSDYLTFICRNMPLRYPLSWFFRMLLTYCPKLYYRINGARGVK